MNLWRRSWTCRLMARVLSVLFLSPLVTALMPQSAMAAGSTIKGSIPVAVVDFKNESKSGGSMLGRRAADAVAVALSETDQFEVSRRSEVENQMAALGLNPPLDGVALMKLGNALSVDSIIGGRVISASVGQNPRQAKVTLAVEMRDVASGELVNGAVATATSGIGAEGCDDDALLDEALNKAAYIAQKTILEYILPQGTVLATTVSMGGNEALVNVGQRSGVRVGMEMIVSRQGEQVGRIRVTKVSANDSTAQIINAPKGVRPEDRVRAIFELPNASPKDGRVAASAAPRKSKISGLGKVIGGLAILAGLVFLASNGDSGGTSRDAIAAADYDTEPIVKLTWKRPKSVKDEDVVQYQIWRSDVFGNYPVGVSYEPRFIDRMATRDVTYYSVDGSVGAGSAAEDIDEEEQEGVPGIVPGNVYNYSVTCIYRTIGTIDNDTEPQEIYKIGVRVDAGQATPVEKPQLSSPEQNDQRSFSSLQFEWSTVRGADAYVVQVSPDPNFTDANSWFSPTVRSNPAANQIISLPQAVSLTRYSGSQVIYWRVGARRDSDTAKPNGSKGWVFSDYRSLTNIDNPPPPPGQ